MAQHRFHDNTNSFNNNSFNTMSFNCTVADDRSQMLTWLSPLEPRLRHKAIQESRVKNVGEWVLEAGEFRSWYASSGGTDSDKAVLFCYGDPGVGKTFISSLVIDSLCDRARGKEFAVACFYFDFAARKEQSSASMLGAVLKQIVSGLETVPEGIAQAYEDQRKVIGGREPQLDEIVKMLQAIAGEKPTFICIDALDECVAGYRVKLLDSLNQILRRSPGTRMFVIGRPHIQAEVGSRLSGRVITIRITPRRHDIINYLHTRLDEDTRPDAMDSSLKADILKKVPDDISEIFLLVSLNIDAILQGTTIGRRRRKLAAMAEGLGLDDAYSETLSRIKGQGEEEARLGMTTLMWISHSERPLKVDELCHALGVEIGSPNLDSDDVPSIGTLLVCCQGLVTVDKEASTVRLIHFTLLEYLGAHPELFGRAHSTMAEICLSYLNSHQVKALSASPSRGLRNTPFMEDSSFDWGDSLPYWRTPFLEYSSLYWGVHAKRDFSDCARLLALKLFHDYSSHISPKILLNAEKSRFFLLDFDKPSMFSGLHCASFFGIVEIVASLLEVEGCDINQTDCTGSTPLIWAALNGHGGIVKMLLELAGVDPDGPDKYDRTPLCCAAGGGREEVVRMLLERDDVNSDKPDKYGQTPLWRAASNGREGVVKILLRRDDVNPDKQDEYGQTPLWCAAMNGHERVVKMLLERDDVNPDNLDHGGRTPLWGASENGHEGVVKILLERGDVNPDRPDWYGQTPLRGAAKNGHEGAVSILLGRSDVNPDRANWCGQTPLRWAALNGHEGVVKILLGRDDVSPDKPDACGRTPLWCAAKSGHEGVVKMLLGWDRVNPDRPDTDGRTPLWCAAMNGYEQVVKILLKRDDVDPDNPDHGGRTPLWVASEGGYEGVVKMLLGRGDVNPDKPDKYGQTPLWCATRFGHTAVIALIRPPSSATPRIE